MGFVVHRPHLSLGTDLDGTDVLGSLCFSAAVFTVAVVLDRLSRRAGRLFLLSPPGLCILLCLAVAAAVGHFTLPLDEYAATGMALVLSHPYLYGFTGTLAICAYALWNTLPPQWYGVVVILVQTRGRRGGVQLKRVCVTSSSFRTFRYRVPLEITFDVHRYKKNLLSLTLQF